MRTTIDIDDPIMRDLKRLQRQQGKSLGKLVSDLLAVAMADTRGKVSERVDFAWETQGMGSRIQLDDLDQVLDALDD